MNIGGLDVSLTNSVGYQSQYQRSHVCLSKTVGTTIKDGHTWGHLKLVRVNPNPTKSSYCTLKLSRRKSALWAEGIQSILASGQ